MKWTIFVLMAVMLMINLVGADLQVGTAANNTMPSVSLTTPTAPVNYSLVNVNNSQYLQGLTPLQVAQLYTYNSTYHTWAYNQTTGAITIIQSYNYWNATNNGFNITYANANYWTTNSNQSFLNGTKSGSYNINTTGMINTSQIYDSNLTDGRMCLIGENGRIKDNENFLWSYYDDLVEAKAVTFQVLTPDGLPNTGIQLYTTHGTPEVGDQYFLTSLKFSPKLDTDPFIEWTAFDDGTTTNSQITFNSDVDNIRRWSDFRLYDTPNSYDFLLYDFASQTIYFANTDIYMNSNGIGMRDNMYMSFGDEINSKIYYDGTNLIINPRAIGIGNVSMQGNLNMNNKSVYNTTDILPSKTSSYSIGSSTLRYLKGWFSGLDVTGNSTFTGNINQTNGNATINNYYGEMWNKSDTGFAKIDLVTASVYVALKNLTGAGSLNGFNLVGGTNLTAQVSGLYQANAKVSVTGGAPAGEYGMKLYVNETGQNNCYDHFHVGGDQVSMIVTCLVRVDAGSNVSIRFDDHVSPVTNLTAHGANINLVRIGN